MRMAREGQPMREMRQTHRRLVVLRISPWSERARWALDHHGLAYETLVHTPFLGERRLRRLVGPTQERATVPVLLTGEQVLTDSWDIAQYADREGAGPKLIPPEHENEVRRWNQLADETMASSRALVTAAMLASPEALDETLPRSVPSWMRPLLRPMGRYAMGWFARKYGLRSADAPKHLAAVRAGLGALRAALSKSSPSLLGSFSYADIVMATSLQGVVPVSDRYIRLGPATRRAWTSEELAAEFSNLIAWRDQLYEQHRR
jgi:glutathione S-transferase